MPDAGAKKQKEGGKKATAVAQPSSSVLLISPQNKILLLHRIKKASSFPSAHVFPGGNLDPFHDGDIPGPDDANRHQDSAAYRVGAIRETFEESGVLLAKNNGFGRLIEVEESVREDGRKKIHGRQEPFLKWLAGQGGRPDIDALIPFTRWITPPGLPKRFTTQMYIYFLPLARADGDAASLSASEQEALIPTPTHDGGIEHTAARFLPAQEWLRLQESGEILMFPPQVFLLTMIAQFLKAGSAGDDNKMPYSDSDASDIAELQRQRQRLREFVRTSDPPWGEKVISPLQSFRRKTDGRVVLDLSKPGLELKGSKRSGEHERVVLVDFQKEGPRRVQVRWKKDVMEEERASQSKL